MSLKWVFPEDWSVSLCALSVFCPAGWRRFGCSCYLLSSSLSGWESSRAQCLLTGSDLVIINSQEEMVSGFFPSSSECGVTRRLTSSGVPGSARSPAEVLDRVEGSEPRIRMEVDRWKFSRSHVGAEPAKSTCFPLRWPWVTPVSSAGSGPSRHLGAGPSEPRAVQLLTVCLWEAAGRGAKSGALSCCSGSVRRRRPLLDVCNRNL